MRISTGLSILGVGLVLGTGFVFVSSFLNGAGTQQADTVTRNVTNLTETGTQVVKRAATKRRGTRLGHAEPAVASPLDRVLEVQETQPSLFNAQKPAGDASRLTQIVAVASNVVEEQNDQLTPEQKQIVGFFERTAREMNEGGGQRLNNVLEFDHLAINGLDVKYYYTVRRNYADLNPSVILSEQRTYITDTVCNDTAVRQLIGDYGFRYSYSYLSAENRLIGRLEASLDNCSG